MTPAGTAGARDVQVTQSRRPVGHARPAASPTPRRRASPTLSAVSPASGPTAGGTAVTLTGTQLRGWRDRHDRRRRGDQRRRRQQHAHHGGDAGRHRRRARRPRHAARAARRRRSTGGFTYTAGTSTDSDGDGLTNDWETLYGLNPNSAAGANGAAGDPDADGRTNAAEQTAGSHPRGTLKRYLAEGVSNSFFSTRFAIANPQASAARVLLTFVDTTGRTTRHYVSVPARTRVHGRHVRRSPR